MIAGGRVGVDFLFDMIAFERGVRDKRTLT